MQQAFDNQPCASM